jgi:hypothetical protein
LNWLWRGTLILPIFYQTAAFKVHLPIFAKPERCQLVLFVCVAADFSLSNSFQDISLILNKSGEGCFRMTSHTIMPIKIFVFVGNDLIKHEKVLQ